MWRFDAAVDRERSGEPAPDGLSVTIGVLPAGPARRFSIALTAEGKELALKQVRVGSGAKGQLYHAIRAGFTRLSKS
jgi:hypothetical protein